MARTFMLPLLAALAMTACAASPTVYGPAEGGERTIGYDSVRIENDRWRVRFTAGPDASRAEASRLALRRAAELALNAGYPAFEVVDERVSIDGERDSPVGVRSSVGFGVGSGGWSGSSVAIGVGVDRSSERRIIAELEIIARSETDEAALRLYDARQVLAAAGRASP